MQKRIERAGTDVIPVVLQLLHHCQSKDGLMHSVQQHVNADEAVEEFPLLVRHVNNYNAASSLRS